MRPLWMVLVLVLAAAYVPAVEPAKPLFLPLDQYRLSPAEAGRVARAHRLLLAQCLAPFGLIVPEPAPPPDAAMVGRNERRYGLTNARHAHEFGYRLPGAAPAAARDGSAQDLDLLAVMSGRGPRVIRGQAVPEGGCYADARRRLHTHAPAARDMYVAQRLDMESHRESKADDRVRAAWAKWSRCMDAKGHRYPDPLAAAGDPAFRGPVSAREITTALADIECKERTGLVRAWSDVEARWQRVMIARHRAELAAVRRAHSGQLAVAHQLGV
ncbi:hypothetical protein [Allorhizocola rhizosphaerae]|uniref:hypothetical protein n=1 Tax=Allorhizocola rhizosphaerae TaxID=1872709 RepID=UPI000E3C0B2A|nr:hypothetical protein [Allorhizocola rhizosphaerae]